MEQYRWLHHPSSVAVVGASSNADKIGGRPIKFMLEMGFGGEIWPVNPGRTEVQGLPAFPTLSALPGVPDVIVVAVPGDAAVAAVREAGELGVKGAVVFSSGFSELNSEEGDRRQAALDEAVEATGIQIVGPNSQGVANFANGAVLSFSTMFIEAPPLDGQIGIVSQSGAMAAVPYGMLRERGLGIRYCHATGNDSDRSVGMVAQAVASDPEVRVILLYIESFSKVDDLVRAAATAKANNCPIIAIVGGLSVTGQVAAASHTGALASEARVIDAFLERLGILRVDSLHEALDLIPLYLKDWDVTGTQVGVLSNSGAFGVLAADALERHGLDLATFMPSTIAELESVLPSFASSVNPVDVTSALLGDSSILGRSMAIIGADENVQSAIIGLPVAGQGYDVDQYARDLAALLGSTRIPLVTAVPQSKFAQKFAEHGAVVYSDEDRAARALAGFIRHKTRLSRHADPEKLVAVTDQKLNLASRAMAGVALNEDESLNRLASLGLSVVNRRVLENEDDVATVVSETGWPTAVLKGVVDGVVHKTELGLVRVGLAGAAAVEGALNDMRRRTSNRGLRLSGAILAEQVTGLHEVLVGAHIDAQFGPCLVLGHGGKYVEYQDDTVVIPLPATEAHIEEGIRSLRVARLFDGVRGEPPADVRALVDFAHRFGEAFVNGRTSAVSIDVNPVMVRAEGEGCVAVDAAVIAVGRTEAEAL